MRIGLAQTKAVRGDIQANIENHIHFIQRAIQLNTGLVIFPELSITGYEPDMAQELSTRIEDEIFNPFQEFSDTHDIIIGVGMPLKTTDGVTISMLIFQPHQSRLEYSKQILHPDELPYFKSGSQQPSLSIQKKRIALGICYETLQREHLTKAKENNAEIYIASVSKPDRGTDRAYLHFPVVAKEFKMTILMVNSVGFCDNFHSNGRSSIWDSEGQLIGELDNANEGLLIYDTDIETVISIQS